MKCMAAGCIVEASWRPVLTWAAACLPDGPRARGELTMGLCNAHRLETTVDDLLTDAGWLQIRAAHAALGKADPARDSVRLEWERVT